MRASRNSTVAALALLLAGACGEEPRAPLPGPTITRTVEPSPTTPLTVPAEPIEFTTGQADVQVTGDVTASFSASIAPFTSEYDASDNAYDLEWRDEAGNTLFVTVTVVTGQVEDAFVGVGAPGSSVEDDTYFADPFHDRCTVTVTEATPAEIEGSFSCTGLVNGDEDMTADATGTFAAAA